MGPICTGCVHLRRVNLAPDWSNLTCAAFPTGIPEAIVKNEADHRKPFPNDHGIRFMPVDEKAAEAATLILDSDPNEG
jgi:hypothetical protein